MNQLIKIIFSTIIISSVAHADEGFTASEVKLNAQIQAQIKALQDQQQQQLADLNSKIQAQLQKVQSDLQNEIQTANTQVQNELKQMQDQISKIKQ